MGRLSTTECTYLPTSVNMQNLTGTAENDARRRRSEITGSRSRLFPCQ